MFPRGKGAEAAGSAMVHAEARSSSSALEDGATDGGTAAGMNMFGDITYSHGADDNCWILLDLVGSCWMHIMYTY